MSDDSNSKFFCPDPVVPDLAHCYHWNRADLAAVTNTWMTLRLADEEVMAPYTKNARLEYGAPPPHGVLLRGVEKVMLHTKSAGIVVYSDDGRRRAVIDLELGTVSHEEKSLDALGDPCWRHARDPITEDGESIDRAAFRTLALRLFGKGNATFDLFNEVRHG